MLMSWTMASDAILPSSMKVGPVLMGPGLCLLICFSAGTKQAVRANAMAWTSMPTICRHSIMTGLMTGHEQGDAALLCWRATLRCTAVRDDAMQHPTYSTLRYAKLCCAMLCYYMRDYTMLCYITL